MIRNKQFYGQVVDLLENDETALMIKERLECYIFNKNFK